MNAKLSISRSIVKCVPPNNKRDNAKKHIDVTNNNFPVLVTRIMTRNR